MTPGLLFPMALAALAAIIVPLVIHIARKSEQHPTDFAALRWLRQKPRPRSRLRFDEWPLLLLRISLVALVALFLAAPVLFDATGGRPYVAIVPGADLTGVALNEARWIAPGFPRANEPAPTGEQPTASLIRQLDAELPHDTALTIIVPQTMSGADADRLHLSRKVTWRIVKGVSPYREPQKAPASPLIIRHDGDHGSELRYLSAVSRAWRDGPVDIGDLDLPVSRTSMTLAWLSGGTVPTKVLERVQAGGIALLPQDALLPNRSTPAPIWRDADSAPIAEAISFGRGRLIRFIRPLKPEAIPILLDPGFPEELRAVIQTPSAAPTRVMAKDYAPDTISRNFDPAPIDLHPWIALCIAILFAVERWAAMRRSRNVAP